MIKCFVRLVLVLGAVLSIISCNDTAKINANIKGANDSEIIVKMLDINRYQVLDTVKTNGEGSLKYKMDIKEGNPEFVYLFHKDVKIASLLLEAGDDVNVVADTLGSYSVEGSEETLKLIEVEKSLSEFSNKFMGLAVKINELKDSPKEAEELKKELSSLYIQYYRDRVKFVLNNPKSLTVVPVLFQNVGGLDVFGQVTDVIHFKTICDSLETVYPESKYLENLKTQTEKKQSVFELQNRFDTAQQLEYPEIELSNIKGEKIKLTSVKSKVVLVHFWTNSEPLQKMFNLDVLKPAYEKFHDKGFEIYQVALDADKAAWANTVKAQGLDWINVCDMNGLNSSLLSLYNIQKLPTSYFIVDGKLIDGKDYDYKNLDALIRRHL